MKKIFTFLFALTIFTSIHAQVIYSEDFEDQMLPALFNNQTNATDGGWNAGNSTGLSSEFFGIIDNGTSGILATNDDACNCNKSNDLLIAGPYDLSALAAAILKFDSFYTDNAYQNDQESVTIEISEDGVNWVVIEDLHGHGSWDTHIIDITSYAGKENIYFGFRYSDNGGWLYGMAMDNFSIEIPTDLDVALVDLESKAFGETNKDFAIKGTLYNQGIQKINSITISYMVDNDAAVTETFDNIDIDAFSYGNFTFTNSWIPTTEGNADITVSILSVNGVTDNDQSNDESSFATVIYGDVIVPNNILDIASSVPMITNMASSAEGLNRPTDLDFFPVLGKDELWVINQRTESDGGSTVRIEDASSGFPSNFEEKVDGNAWHFMSLPTAIAFSDDNYNFANSAGVQDANHNGGTFTGPALWSSDPAIYAEPSGGNGSHLDMLHGSPFSMGIAHEVDNVFWVYDDWNKDIVRYDFADDHGPGNDDHADGKLRRYQNIGITKDADIPNHLILDKTSGWLYFIDNGNNRVMRLDINSGNVGANLSEINEPLTEHVAMANFTVEEIISTDLDRPCGIEVFENFLLVGNYGNGDIGVYDINDAFAAVGTISTNDAGLTGIKVGPDGNIYATNRITNSLISIQKGDLSSNEELDKSTIVNVYPNPSADHISFNIATIDCNKTFDLSIYDVTGKLVLNNKAMTTCQTIDVSAYDQGSYSAKIVLNEKVITESFTVIHE